MSLLTPLRLGAATALAALAAAAGCGGDGGGAASAEGAGLVPSSTAVFISLNTDFESDQWQAAEALAERFPGGGEAIQSLFESFAAEGIDVETELKPALGPETDLAILELSDELQSQDSAPIVLLTQPSDPSKLEALVADGDDEAVVRDVGDGWYMVADSDAIVDGVLAGAEESPLAGDDAFEQAMAALEEDAVAKLYLNGGALVEGLKQSLEEQSAGVDLDVLGVGGLQSVALAVRAEEQGAVFDGVVRSVGAGALAPYVAELADIVPADALLYASFSNLRTGLEQLLELASQQTPEFDQQLGQLEVGLGISLEDDLLPLFEGEHAFYVRPGLPIPELTLLLTPADLQKGLATLDKLVTVAAFAGGISDPSSSFEATDVTIGGIQAKKLDFGGPISPYYALVGDHLVLTTAEKGIADLAAPGATLAGDPLYQEAKQAAGLPDQSLGFLYVNLEDALPLLEGLGSLLGTAGSSAIDPATLENLRPLQYLVVYATAGEGETRFSGFLGIK